MADQEATEYMLEEVLGEIKSRNNSTQSEYDNDYRQRIIIGINHRI